MCFVFRKKLKEARADAVAMTHQINDNLKTITESEKKARDLGKTKALYYLNIVIGH